MFLKPHQKPRYLRFQYKPRFWDPQKERIEELKKRIKERNQEAAQAQKTDKEVLKERVRQGFRQRRTISTFNRRSVIQSENRKSNFRLLIILIAILWLTYKLLVVYL